MSGNRTEIDAAETGLLPETVPVAHPEPHDPGTTPPKSPREIMMDQIVANAQRQREAELAQAEVYDREAREAGLNAPEDQETSAPPAAIAEPRREVGETVQSPAPARQEERASDPAAPPSQPAQPQLIPIDLGGGVPVYVTQEQIIHLARMGAIANQTLHDYQQQQQRPALPGVQAPQPQPVRQSEPVVDEGRVRQVVRKMQFGTEDDGTVELTGFARDLVRAVQPASPPQVIDTQAIVRQATIEALARMQLQRDLETINAEFPDIVSNPQLTRLAAINVDDVRREMAALGRQVSDLEIYREAGHRVRDALGKPRPGTQTEQQQQAAPLHPPAQAAAVRVSPDRARIDERKRAAPRQTGQVIDQRNVAPPAPPVKTGSDIVEEFRKARFQPSMR